jgi:hypothetical protein
MHTILVAGCGEIDDRLAKWTSTSRTQIVRGRRKRCGLWLHIEPGMSELSPVAGAGQHYRIRTTWPSL